VISGAESLSSTTKGFCVNDCKSLFSKHSIIAFLI
jgi:hypothetical protein